MLELIFQGLIEWVYGLIMEAWEYFASVLLDLMDLDFSYLSEHMPVIEEIAQIMLAIGWALLMGNLVFQAIKTMMSGIGFEGEDPKLLFTRTFVFAFLLLASPQICRLILNMTSEIIDIMKLPKASEIEFADEASFDGLAAAWLLVIICGIIVMFQSFKLILEMAERYLILAILTITAPLAFGTGGSRNTSDIFTGWCRMFGSMCLLMVMNVVFVKLLLSVLSFYPSGVDVLPWMVLVLSVVKVAKKADGIITRIGLNPAITGDPLGRTFPGTLTYMVARALASNAIRAIGKSNANRGSSGRSPKAPNSGPVGPNGPKPVTPTGGSRLGNSSTTTQQETQQNSQQYNTTQEGGKQATSNHSATRSAQDAASNVPSTVGGSAYSQGSSTRRSAVPPEMRKPSPDRRPIGTPGIGKLPRRPDAPPADTRRSHTTGANPALGAKSGTASAETARQGHNASGEGNSRLSGQAGTGALGQETRRTSVPGRGLNQTVQEGSASGAVQAREQNNTVVNEGSSDGKPVIGSPIGVGSFGPELGHDAAATRFTQLDHSSNPTPGRPVSSALTSEHPGPAGTGAGHREATAVIHGNSSAPSRPDRPAPAAASNSSSSAPAHPTASKPMASAPAQPAVSRPTTAAPAQPTVSRPAASSSPARQEPTRPVSGTGSSISGNRASYNGTAGKAQSPERISRARSTPQGTHVNVPPAHPAGGNAVKRTPPIAPSAQSQKSRPSKRNRGGQKHGKQE